MSETPPERPPPTDPIVAWSERWVMPYLRDSDLWPVLFALLGSAVVVLGVVIRMAWRAETPWAIGAVVFLFLTTLDVGRREVGERKRPGALTFLLLSLWGAGGLIAWGAGRLGLL